MESLAHLAFLGRGEVNKEVLRFQNKYNKPYAKVYILYVYTLSVKLQHDEQGLMQVLLFEIENCLITDFSFSFLSI